MTTKQSIIADLYRLLFQTNYTSDPDNWELNTTLAKGLLHHHGVYFKEAHEVVGSIYWSTNDVEDHFYDYICPGIVLPLHQFEDICENYIDWDMWEAVRRCKSAGDVFADAKKAIDKCLEANSNVPVFNKAKN